MKAKDLMTKDVLMMDKDDRLQEAIDVMAKHRVSKLVVVDKGQVVGVLTDGDIADELGALKTRGIPASHLHVSSAMRKKFATATPDTPVEKLLEILLEGDIGLVPVLHEKECLGVVTGSDVLTLVTSTKPLADVMTNHLHVVAPTDRIIHARRMMLDHHVDRLPVLDSGKLVGILGELDIAIGFAKLKTTVADKHQAAALQRFLVSDAMQPTLVTATPETTAREAVVLMRKEDVGSLPVLRGDRIVGIVTRSDLLKLLAQVA